MNGFSVFRLSKRSRFFGMSWLTGILLCGLSLSAVAEETEKPADDQRSITAFENLSIISTETGEVNPDQTVLVVDGRIRRVGPAGSVAIPDGAEVIDGAGRYLMPGMAEMHGHLPTAGPDEQAVEDLLFLYVANGVTLVRGMQGHPEQIRTREAIEGGRLLGPRLVLGSPAIGWGNTPETDEGPGLVDEFKEAGFDLIKIGEGLDPETYKALVSAADQAGLPVAGHVPDEVGLLGVLEAGQVTIDHLDNYIEDLVPEEDRTDLAALWGVASVADKVDEDRIPELVEATVESRTAQVPTMVLWEVFFGDVDAEELRESRPEVRYMPTETVDNWVEGLVNLRETIGHPEGARRVVELRRQVFSALHEAGAEFLLGTDSPQLFSVPGFSNHREMTLWVELGMSPAEVIKTGTWNVADHFGELDEAGSVDEGKRADLILLDANPLDDIGNIGQALVGVMVNGHWLPESKIQARLQEIAGRAGP